MGNLATIVNRPQVTVRYLNFKQLCEKLGGRSRSSIYRDLEHERLPQPVKLGGRLYWVEEDVDAWLRK